MATAASLLVLIDAAIEAIVVGGASSYSIGARSVSKLDLPALFAERRQLQAEVERDASGGAFSLAKMQGRSRG